MTGSLFGNVSLEEVCLHPSPRPAPDRWGGNGMKGSSCSTGSVFPCSHPGPPAVHSEPGTLSHQMLLPPAARSGMCSPLQQKQGHSQWAINTPLNDMDNHCIQHLPRASQALPSNLTATPQMCQNGKQKSVLCSCGRQKETLKSFCLDYILGKWRGKSSFLNCHDILPLYQ